MRLIRGKQVIVSGFPKRVERIAETLGDAGMSVIKVSAADAGNPLIAAAKRHQDAHAIVIISIGDGLRDQSVEHILRQVRQATRAPILLVMMNWYLQDRQRMLSSGATEILGSRRLISDVEIAGQVFDIVAPVSAVRRVEYRPPDIVAPRTKKVAVPPPLVSDAKHSYPHLVIGYADGRRKDVIFYGRRFQLSNQLCKVLELLCHQRDGVGKEDLYRLGIARNPQTVAVVISNLRKKLWRTEPRWGRTIVLCDAGRYSLNFSRLAYDANLFTGS